MHCAEYKDKMMSKQESDVLRRFSQKSAAELRQSLIETERPALSKSPDIRELSVLWPLVPKNRNLLHSNDSMLFFVFF